MYSSIDLALAKMERQVRRYKDRITGHQANAGRAHKVRASMIASDTIDALTEAKADVPERSPVEALPAVVREKEYKADRLGTYEAIMQMNLLHKQFLVFTNIKTGDINVVYRAEEGYYGLIETRGHVDDGA
jgi:putative sigma-54 modulation protein